MKNDLKKTKKATHERGVRSETWIESVDLHLSARLARVCLPAVREGQRRLARLDTVAGSEVTVPSVAAVSTDLPGAAVLRRCCTIRRERYVYKNFCVTLICLAKLFLDFRSTDPSVTAARGRSASPRRTAYHLVAYHRPAVDAADRGVGAQRFGSAGATGAGRALCFAARASVGYRCTCCAGRLPLLASSFPEWLYSRRNFARCGWDEFAVQVGVPSATDFACLRSSP